MARRREHGLQQRLLRADQPQRVPIEAFRLGCLIRAEEQHDDIRRLGRHHGTRDASRVRLARADPARLIRVVRRLHVADLAALRVGNVPTLRRATCSGEWVLTIVVVPW